MPHSGSDGPGELLRGRRKAKGLRQEDLAALLGTDRWRIGTWEREKHEPSAEYRPGLAEHLGGSPDDYRWPTRPMAEDQVAALRGEVGEARGEIGAVREMLEELLRRSA